MDFKNVLNDIVLNNRIPGACYSIIKDDDIIIGNCGYKQLVPTSINNSLDTLYDVASLTKVIVTVTILSKLIDKGIISLNDKVIKYIPYFKYDNITIYDLLTHTSGLPADFKSKEIVSRDKIMNDVYNAPLEYETGCKVLYSDIGYIILGNIIEKIYGKNLDEIALSEVFIPLHMKDTCYNPSVINRCAPTEVNIKRGMVKGVVHDEKCYSMGGISGHAGIFTSISDITNFVRMILNDGVFDGKRFLSKEMIDLWFSPLVHDDRYRSFSWFVGENSKIIKRKGNIISFSGFTGPSISIDRDNNLGIVILTNRIHPSRDKMDIFEVRNILSDQIYKDFKIVDKKKEI